MRIPDPDSGSQKPADPDADPDPDPHHWVCIQGLQNKEFASVGKTEHYWVYIN